MKNLKRETNGITLVALVITIIILLILAGIVIAALTGENGLITRAQEARTKTEEAQRKEEEQLAELEALATGKDVPIIQVDDKNPGQLEQEDTNTMVINSIEDLVFFSYDVANGNRYENKTVKLGTNLDFNSDKSYVDPNRTNFGIYGYDGPLKQLLTTSIGFDPIGENVGENNFYGTFDGDNKAICSLYINMKSDAIARAGLFSTSYGVIQNLGLVDVNISAESIIGGVVATSYNNIYNCYVTGNINATGSSWMPVGGICGTFFGNVIENSYNLASIECKNIKPENGNANITLGGIVGQIEGEEVTINKCFNKGNLTADGGNNEIEIGGICGNYTSTVDTMIIKNSYNNAKIVGKTLNGTYNISGITTLLPQQGKVINCYNSGEIVAEGNTESNFFRVGGIVAYQDLNSEVANVFNIGGIKVNIQTSNGNLVVGGIAGNTNWSDTVKMNYAYNTGKIELESAISQNIGSISGNLKLATLNNCYYLKGTYDVAIGNDDSIKGIQELDSIDEFPSVLEVVNGEGVFKEDTNNINNGYPILQWQ